MLMHDILAHDDAYIWSMSPIRRIMEQRYNNGERNWLIGKLSNNLVSLSNGTK